MRTRISHVSTLLVFLALAGCKTSTATASPADRFTPEHVAKIRSVGGALISPNGQHVAYTLHVPRIPFKDDNGAAFTELHVADRDGNTRPFISGEVSVAGVRWTPDGRGLSFLDKRGKDKHTSVYVLPVDGGEARRAVTHASSIVTYAWSPDGKQVAFVAAPKNDDKIEKLEKKGFNAEVVEERWRNKELWVADAEAYRTDITADEAAKAKRVEIDGSVSSVKWGPDGTYLLAAVAPTPSIDDHYMQTRLHVVDAKSFKDLRTIATPGKLGDYAFSPDGTRAVMISALDINDPSEGRLVVASLKTAKFEMYLKDWQGQVENVEWPLDDTIVYGASVGVHNTLSTIKPDGTGAQVILGDERVFHGLSVSADGKHVAFTQQSFEYPSELFVSEIAAGAKPKRLTTSNPWLGKLSFAKQEAISFTARDGLEVQGVLIHPLNKPAGPAPLIVGVHGGPESHLRNGWLTYYSYPGQVGAAEGFYVFYPNYRGSTGRGVEFSKAGQGDYGGKEFDDIIDGIDHLAAKGLIDKTKVGVTGGSYGGFASAWMATKHTDRFAASVMFVGISDQVSKFGTTDIPNEMFHVHARKWPWQDWDFFRERSPITYVEQARTPILILHGKNDTRVHPSQSMELFRYLKTIGKTPVRLVLYPGEGHGNRKSASRYDYNLRLIRWMKHYLTGAGGEPPKHEVDYGKLKPPKKADDEGETPPKSDS